MPDIDVTDLMFDSDVAGEKLERVVRRGSATNANGQVVVTSQVITTGLVGAIYPVGDNSLMREEAFQSQMNAIEVVTTFRLRGASKDLDTGNEFQPDLVFYKGAYYAVRTLNDFSSYGAGFIQAECIQFDWVDPTTPKGSDDDDDA